jgi:polynucleotide 5'-hydroxyl-kinase GRC3/NOL9
MDDLPPLPAGFKVPEEWQRLAKDALGGTVILVGATDTGKSTLAHWLIEKARRRRQTAAWLDADLGQSSLGLPGTLNLVTVVGGSSDAMDRASFFVGSTSPRGHMLQVLTGLCRLRDCGRSKGADPLFVDTSGLIAEESGGGALKEWEVELLVPTAIVALQRGQELEHVLAPWRHDPRFRVYILPVAPGVRRRPPQERAERRRILLRRFFDGAATLCIYKGQTPIYGLKHIELGCLAGLINREGFLLSAAVVRKIMPDMMELLSPCSSVDQVAAVRVGKLRIDPLTGMELGRS